MKIPKLIAVLILIPGIACASSVCGPTVSGTYTVQLTLSQDIWWTQLVVDGVITTSGTNRLNWNTTTSTNGCHTLVVNGYLQNSHTPVAQSTVASVYVSNSTRTPTPTATATATDTPTETATPTPTPTPTLTPVAGVNASTGTTAVSSLTTNTWKPQAGNMVAVFVEIASTSISVAHVTDSLSNTYFLGAARTGSAGRVELWYSIGVKGGSSNAVKVTFTTLVKATVRGEEFAGVPTNAILRTTNTNASAVPGNNATTGSVTTTGALSYLLAAIGWDSASSSANTQGGFSKIGQLSDGDATATISYLREFATIPGTSGTGVTLTPGANWQGVVAAFADGPPAEYRNYTLSSAQTFDCGGGKVKSITITASNVTVQNCEITSQQNGNFGYGVHVTGSSTHNITIQNNYIHDLCQDGIFFDPNAGKNNLVKGNTIVKASSSGVTIQGTGTTVDGNDISNTQQYPDRAGGIFSGCTEKSAGDADADTIRFFGSNHIIKNNYLHDIPWGTDVNPDPHIDCFQTWGSYDGPGGITSNILITGNYCVWPSTSDDTDNEISSIEELNGSTTTGITYSYNVFGDMRNGIVIEPGVDTMVFDHNTVDHILNGASLQFPGSTTPASEITNNIFYDCGRGIDSFASGTGMTISNNDCIMRGGADCGSTPNDYPHVSVDPLFVSNGTGSTPWLNADYHLQSGSPVQSMGACDTNDADACPPVE